MKKRILFFLCSVFFFLFISIPIYAADYKADYQVEYFLSQNNNNISSTVRFNIQIQNLKSDIYVNKFSINFPKSFHISNITGSDDNGSITPEVTEDASGIKVAMEFKNPKVGRDSINNFYLQFDQNNLFTVNGNIWEVILPTVENHGDNNGGTYKVIVNLPQDSIKKISIAKPKPDYILGKQIIWNNPMEKTIYAIFGDSQKYQLDLTYHLKNPKIIPIFTEIVLPPDTLNQKTYLRNLSLIPESVRQDEDGNLMAKYFLNPRETKTINYSGIVEIYPKPRDEVRSFIAAQTNDDRKYLTTENNFWSVAKIRDLPEFNGIKDIYDFTVNTLKYDYNKLTTSNVRLGAANALLHPDQSVCVEYSDVFIALTRSKGIMSREIEGYGFSEDSQLRPLSLNSDILHSWPEYYDSDTQIWKTVDPTWEHTSGIDYFHSLDLNHIVFAIHGRQPDYPLPAGMYKLEDSHDVSVKPTADSIAENKKLNLNIINLPAEFVDNKSYKSDVIVQNTGNVYQWNIPVKIQANNLTVNNRNITIKTLAPYEQYDFPIQIASNVRNKKTNINLEISSGDTKIIKNIQIIPYYYNVSIKLFWIALILGIPAIGFILLKKVKK